MNFFTIFSVLLILSSYFMVMREHSANGLDAIISKQKYEYNYYLCSALLDYGIAFYKAEKHKLAQSGSILINSWPESGSVFSGKISWSKSEKAILIKAELLKQAKTEFSMEANLSLDNKDSQSLVAKIITYSSI